MQALASLFTCGLRSTICCKQQCYAFVRQIAQSLAMSAALDFRKCKRLLLSSLAVSALYRGPRGILCTRGEKEYASIRQPTAACDNRLVKNEAYDDSPRKFICAEDVNGQKVTLTGLLTAHTALLKSHCRGDNAHSFACVRLIPTGTQYPTGSPIS